MLRVVSLSKEEVTLLGEHYRRSGARLIRERAHALLLSHGGRRVGDIAQILMRSERVVRDWIHAYEEARISSLFPHYIGNDNASKLTVEQRQEIKRVLQQIPSAVGLPSSFWTVKTLKSYLSATFGVVYESERSYHYLFKLSHLSWKLPSTFDVRRNDEVVATRLLEIRQEIAPFLADPNWEVIVADETRLVWKSEIRRAWLQTGKHTVIKVHRERQAQSFFGTLSLKTGQPHLFPLAWQNEVEIIAALTKLRHNIPHKRLCLIWDNARWHKGRQLREQLRAGQPLASLHLINLPPYAPDTNPQEHVWKDAKDQIANAVHETFDQTITTFITTVLRRFYPYQL